MRQGDVAMMRKLAIGLVCAAVAFGSSAAAAPLQLIVGAPDSYVPGQPVAFEVRLPAIANLGAYNIDLALESNAGTGGVDFYFDVAGTIPASANYVFPLAQNYFDAATTDSSTRHRLSLTDFDLAGVDVVPGANDRVATVTLRTSSTFNGPLSLFVDAPLLILDTPDIVPTAVVQFAAIQSDIAAAGPFELSAVPEPSALFLVLVMGAAAMIKRRAGRSFFPDPHSHTARPR
jgi:hypothetical protein